MAAVYLHNALHSHEPSSTPPTPCNRNFLRVSTLHAGTSEFSYPTEPLLHSSTSESLAYRDLLSRQPAHPSGSQRGWIASLSFDGDPISTRERKGYRDQFVRRRLRRLKLLKSLLEIVMAAWAAYNAVRYFLAYKKYGTKDGQLVSLVMGLSTSASFAFLTCAWVLSTLQPYLLAHHISVRFLLFSRIILRGLASSLLLAPAIVNFVLLFIWKNSTIPELNVRQSCHVDLDLTWSISYVNCKPSAWWLWLTVTLTRLLTTLCVLISYHLISSAYHRLRQPSLSSKAHRVRSNSSDLYQASLHPSMTVMSDTPPVIPRSYHPPQHNSSDSTLQSTPNSKISSSNHHTVGASIGYSDEDLDAESYGPPSNGEAEGSKDRFHSLIFQITQETEDGLAMAFSPEASPAREGFNLPNIPLAVGYDEFGRPYPPDETLFVFNGIVRRMPTIESMGSREVGSLTASSMYSGRDTMPLSVMSTPASSRANTMSVSDYGSSVHPHSRSDSIASGAEILLAMGRTSEVGELMDSEDGRGGHTGTGTDSSYPSSVSYYTASSYRSGVLGPGRTHSPQSGSFGLSG